MKPVSCAPSSNNNGASCATAPTTAGFDPRDLGERLPPLQLNAPRVFSAEEAAYLAFYGLDFAQRLPGVSHDFGVLQLAGHRVPVHFWQPAAARGTVTVLHGYFDHVGLYRHLIGFLLGEGYCVLAMDLPGHGLASGERASIDSFDTYIEVLAHCQRELASQGPAPRYMIGQSMGAALAMEWALREGFSRANSPLAGMVLLAPLVRPRGWPLARLAYLWLRHFIHSQPRRFQPNSSDPEFLRFLRDQDPLQPRHLPVRWITAMVHWMREFERRTPCDLAPMVIQGDRDGTVDARYNLAVVGRLFQPEVIHVPGGRHHLVNESPAVRAQIFSAVGSYLAARAESSGS